MNYTFSDKVATIQPSAIREILKFASDPNVISLSAGNPAPEAFPTEKIAEITAKIFKDDPILALQYSITEGYTPLRDRLKAILQPLNCYVPDRDELIITSGAQQGNELACKVLLNEGDTLICESPSFIGSLNAFKSYNVNLVGVELQHDGMNMEMLEQTLKKNPNTKLIYVIPNFQNPTGGTMSLEKRKELYRLAQKYDVFILEDNPYGRLRIKGKDVPPIKSLDTDGRVIYTGSFSKILSPGLRVGYVSGLKEIVSKMIVCKQVADVHTNILAQLICDRFIEETDMEKHFETLREIYRKKCNLMVEQINKNFSSKITFNEPEGGLFIWCTLPNDCNMNEFCTRAIKDYKVAVVPGNAFTIHDSDPTSSFRLNFSTPTDDQIIKGCELLGKLSKELFGE
ncbi:MAG: PLP-dependent aminotransferase family protein [Oscillospiraceae bacterium]